MSWPPTSDVEEWTALADPDGHWMTERVAIKAAAGVKGDLVEQARVELRAMWKWVRRVEEAVIVPPRDTMKGETFKEPA